MILLEIMSLFISTKLFFKNYNFRKPSLTLRFQTNKNLFLKRLGSKKIPLDLKK